MFDGIKSKILFLNGLISFALYLILLFTMTKECGIVEYRNYLTGFICSSVVLMFMGLFCREQFESRLSDKIQYKEASTGINVGVSVLFSALSLGFAYDMYSKLKKKKCPKNVEPILMAIQGFSLVMATLSIFYIAGKQAGRKAEQQERNKKP